MWAHACTGPKLRALEKIQKTGGQAITGAFNTVALAVIEAEASILSIHERFKKKALKAWIAMHTLPKTHPLSRLPTRAYRRFMSPLQKMAIQTTTDVAREQARDTAEGQHGIVISTSSSQRNNLVGIGFALRDRDQDDSGPSAYLATIATPVEQNPFIAELQAMAMALRAAATQDRPRQITVVSSNKAALLAVAQPRQQSGQEWLLGIYETNKRLKARGHTVHMTWSPAGVGWPQERTTKGAAKLATKPHQRPDPSARRAKSTRFNKAVISTVQRKSLPPRVGKYSKDLDTALPGRHPRKLYDGAQTR
ncbi:hypothetical protein JX265_013656 [Neoarthrinium moseri]|uniref:RNase H type-1 domain-containing protein n=1 Tax=Neoarthrinium moseri TaxID=1658444 RepID=A0A9P9W815_9PEZI|nr:hypothetical protein JX265_013656 [Neoarthrinium moseri]